ncbi:MAG: glycosyltransferase family 1 protein, partial [Pseudomonadota bacterium]
AARRLAEARLRRHALPGGLRALPRGAVYVNVGHANLRDESFAALRTAGAETVVVMIHDTIPLDFPEHARTGTPELFRARLAAVGRAADLVIYNSEDTGRQAARHFAALGRVPPGAVIPLGLDPPAPTRAIVADPPAFVALGTIEPRKNHALLLDVWARLAADPPAGGLPPLHIIGRRGWAGPDLLARLDARPEGVEELGPLTDAEMQGRLAGARALLFPSFAEGFGFPLAEALQRGVPVIASDLPALRALGGDQVTWCDPADPAGWEAAIRVCAAPHTKRPEAVEFPTWSDHLHELTAVLRRHCDGVSDQR